MSPIIITIQREITLSRIVFLLVASPYKTDFIVYNYICTGIFKTGQNQKILLTKLSFLELHNPRSLPKKLHQ